MNKHSSACQARQRAGIIGAAVFIALLIGTVVYQQTTQSSVTVVNRSDRMLNLVTVSVEGDSAVLKYLAGGGRAVLKVRPNAQSAVLFSFVNASGVRRQWRGGSLGERRGRMTLIVQPDETIRQTAQKP